MYSGTISAAGVDPDDDLTYFTEDDVPVSSGNINRVIFGRNALSDLTGDDPFGLLAGGSIRPFYWNGQLFDEPLTLDQFRITCLD